MYARIIGGILIQLSQTQREGFAEVIVDAKPDYDHTTHHLNPNYAIVDDAVHQTWAIVEGEAQITDTEALDIIKG